jgi:L-idonate 5-dehydrogenase
MMHCWVLYGKEDIRLERRPVPKIKADEVLIKVKQAGICGSDLAYYRHGKVGNYKPSRPFIPGHEFSGEIVEIGSSVNILKPNDRVAVDPSMNCGVCEYCLSGRSNLCRKMKFLGSAMYVPPIDGAFREYLVMPAKNCSVLPAEINYDTGALLEPMSVAYYALKRAGDIKGKTVLISGAGTIGQLILLFAIALEAEKVCITDPLKAKRDMGLKNGAHRVFDPSPEDFIERAKEEVPYGFDVVMEASGSVHALRQGILLAKPGGTFVQVGIPPPEDVIPLGEIFFKELNYLASFRFCEVFEEVMGLCASGDLEFDNIISRTFPFSELGEAIMYAIETRDTFKIQLRL